MLKQIPSDLDLRNLIGVDKADLWNGLCDMVNEMYEMEELWDNGGKAWTYHYRFRRGGKTLCTLCAKEKCIAFLVIFGKDERAKFENNRQGFSSDFQHAYDNAMTYHDGKWIFIEPNDTSLFEDFRKALLLKRKPHKNC